jgi:putative hydrolase of the HAD superfamily
MCIPARHRVSLFPDARELLATIKHEGLRCVVFSNTVWRRARSYWRDFEAFDVAHLVDAVVASVDLGVRKPHRAMFEASADAGGISLDRCVVIGNSERLDVEPARALGLRVLRVAIEEPVPHTSQADRTASSLHEAAEVLQTWCRGREQQES